MLWTGESALLSQSSVLLFSNLVVCLSILASHRAPIFKEANKPVFEKLYKSVRDGSETKRTLEFASRKSYREDFKAETDAIDAQEMWVAGKTVRSLRPGRTTKDL